MSQPEKSLYALGWRQGSVFEHELHICVNRLSESGVAPDITPHRKWIIATQDCDLAGAALDALTEIEIWPLYVTDEIVGASIRNKKFGISAGWMVNSPSARGYIEARALAGLRQGDETPSAQTYRHFKTWLGRRYDRPALPKEYETAAKAITNAVRSLRDRDADKHIRDVLMVFVANAPFSVDLVAVMHEASAGEVERVELWLGAVAAKVGSKAPLRRWRAVPESLISLLVIEHSYPADLSQITIDDEEDSAP